MTRRLACPESKAMATVPPDRETEMSDLNVYHSFWITSLGGAFNSAGMA